jgi:hypothetical protein
MGDDQIIFNPRGQNQWVIVLRNGIFIENLSGMVDNNLIVCVSRRFHNGQ